MNDLLQDELQKIKKRQSHKQKWEKQIAQLEDELNEARQRCLELKKELDKEEKDVVRVESLSVLSILLTLSGRKLEKIDKEKREALAAELEYEESSRTVRDLEAELPELRMKLADVAGADQDYEEWLARKLRWMNREKPEQADDLSSLMNQVAEQEAQIQEYEEAIAAGKDAEEALVQARAALSGAEDLSVWDMFGGGTITTMMKRDKMRDADDEIHQAQKALRRFNHELSDVSGELTLPATDDFLSFADYFFDGILTDWMVHRQIKESAEQVSQALEKLATILQTLETQLERLIYEKDTTGEERRRILETM
ncbi:MAG: hypothetical protein ABF651_05190 [Sporolactobacillus sp.]